MIWKSYAEKANWNMLASGTKTWDYSRSGKRLYMRPNSGSWKRSYAMSHQWGASDSGYSYKQKMGLVLEELG